MPDDTHTDGCGTPPGSDGCSEWQGDCDDDSQCAGDLECFQRRSTSATVPGCSTTAAGYHGSYDYCYDRTQAECTDETGGYIRREVGNCGSHLFIENQEDCAAAAEALGLKSMAVLATTNSPGDTDSPYGCYLK